MKRVFVIAVLALASVAFASEAVEESTTVNEFIVKAPDAQALKKYNEEDDGISQCDSDISLKITTLEAQSAPALVTVNGIITDTNGIPVNDVLVLLSGNNSCLKTHTDPLGYYEFKNVENNHSYTIAPCKYRYKIHIEPPAISGDTIVAIALGELGNSDGDIPNPGRYHGHGGGWCSEFVSWVYWQAGDPFTGGATDGGACDEDWNMSTSTRIFAGFGRNPNWQFLPIDEIPDYLDPEPGDYVFITNTTWIDRSHSCLVKSLNGTTMHTVDGNVNDLVAERNQYNWRTTTEGNSIVGGIGFRRVVSSCTFIPINQYVRYLTSNTTQGFTIVYTEEEVVAEQSVTLPFITATGIQYEQVNFAYDAPTTITYTLHIFDVTGRGVYNQSGQLTAGSGQITYNPVSLSEGVYFWRISTEQGEVSGKFVYVK